MNEDFFHSSNLGYEMYDSFYVGRVLTVKKDDAQGKLPTSSCHTMIFITEGDGTVELEREYDVSAGDVILLPPFRISPTLKDAEYVAIRFRGGDTKAFSLRYDFAASSKIYRKISELIPLFKSLSDLDERTAVMRAKGLIYYTFSALRTGNGEKDHVPTSVAERIKDYIDENFADRELSLATIGEALSYHKNYVSKVFNEHYGISVSKYTNILRTKHAKLLLEEGEFSVKEICSLTGFNDTEYFSSVFKAIYGETPKDFQKRITNNGTGPI